MRTIFRPWRIDEMQLLPPTVQDYVPADHPAHFVRDLVRESIDLSAIYASYKSDIGQPPYDPRLMVALLLYCYSQGIYSSRRISRACEERLDVMAVTAGERPDFHTVSEFRRRNLKTLAALFQQVLKLCRKAGLASLNHVSLDGTKVKANASKHKAMSYGRMVEREVELEAEVKKWLESAEAIDAEEDAATPGRRGDEMPEWVANKAERLRKIREAKAALEAEAREQSEAKRRGRNGGKDDGHDGGDPPASGPMPPAEPALPKDKAQRNFTDPESRIMKTRDGFEQSYNAQAAVDADNQIIVACDLSACGADVTQQTPMLDEMEKNGVTPKQLSEDAGYCSEENLAELERRGIDGYVATGRQKHGTPSADGGRSRKVRVENMRQKLRDGGFDSPYHKRKTTVEPVFGQIKECRGFRRFLLRGLDKVKAEWSFVCTVHNLCKMAKLRTATA
jgi:transposase